MPDDVSRLRATLTELQEQLAALGHVNPDVRARLESALADVHRILDQGTPQAAVAGGAKPGIEQEETIVDRLSAAERHFEQTHPTIAGIVGSVINALSRMGI